LPDCEKNCVLAARVDRLEEDMKSEKENRQKTHSEIYDRLRKVESDQAVSRTKLDTITDKLDSLDGKMDTLLSKPGKRWEAVIAAVISAVVGGLIVFVMTKIGLG
jgi:chromosome segregation ATPase